MIFNGSEHIKTSERLEGTGHFRQHFQRRLTDRLQDCALPDPDFPFIKKSCVLHIGNGIGLLFFIRYMFRQKGTPDQEELEEAKILQGDSSRFKRIKVQHPEFDMVDPISECFQGVGAPGLEAHRQIQF